MNSCKIPKCSKDFDGDGRKMSMHLRFVKQAETAREPVDVLFIGDSIIEQFQFSTIYCERISNQYNCLNFGVGGDRVENVLWRIQNGELTSFKTAPKCIVIHAGTNNNTPFLGERQPSPPEDTSDGLVAIVDQIFTQFGNKTQILVTTLLPRGQYKNPYRDRNVRVNSILEEKLSNRPNVHLVDISRNIIDKDGTISHNIMHDYLHLTDSAYSEQFWPVCVKLDEILNNL